MSTPPLMTTTMTPPGGDDWQNDLTLTESNRYMLENQIDCDVWFTLLPSGGAAGEELPVTVGSHRYMLVSRSPVFYAMLSGPLAVSSTSRTQPSPSPSQHRRHHHHQQQQQHQRAARQDEQTSDPSATRQEIRITDIAPNTFWQLLRFVSVDVFTHNNVHSELRVSE